MKVKSLRNVLYSTHGLMQFGIIVEENKVDPIEKDGTIDYYIEKYADREVKRIFADRDYIVFVLREEKK